MKDNETRKGYDYLKHVEAHTGKKMNLTGREKTHIASELDRRESRFVKLNALIRQLAECEHIEFMELIDISKYHKTRHRK